MLVYSYSQTHRNNFCVRSKKKIEGTYKCHKYMLEKITLQTNLNYYV